MTVGDPRSYHVSLEIPADRYEELLKLASQANHPTVESYLLALGASAPKAEIKAGQVVFHSVPQQEESKKK